MPKNTSRLEYFPWTRITNVKEYKVTWRISDGENVGKKRKIPRDGRYLRSGLAGRSETTIGYKGK